MTIWRICMISTIVFSRCGMQLMRGLVRRCVSHRSTRESVALVPALMILAPILIYSAPLLPLQPMEVSFIFTNLSRIYYTPQGVAGPISWLSSRTTDTELTRRRSWTALEDLSVRGTRPYRQRSVSLSSMESEQEDPFSEHGSTAHLLSSAKPVAVGRRGGASTHSLNEADLQVKFD